MRKTAKISGIITTVMVVLGVFMKMRHWPGGSILVILGVGAFSAVSLTSLMFYKRKIATTQLEKVEAGLSWFAGSILAVGLLFAVQHWPGSGSNLLMGIFLSVIFLIVHFINVSKYDSDRKKFGVFDVLIVVMFTMLFVGRVFAIQRTIDIKKQIAEYNELRITESKQWEENDQLYGSVVNNFLKDSSNKTVYLNAKLIHEKTRMIFDYVMAMRGKLVAISAGVDNHVGDTLRVELLDHPTDFDTPTHYMIGSDPLNITGESKHLREAVTDYYHDLASLMAENSREDFSLSMNKYIPLTMVYPKDSRVLISWEQAKFYHKTIIEALTTVEEIEINILKAEDEAFKQIQKSSPN